MPDALNRKKLYEVIGHLRDQIDRQRATIQRLRIERDELRARKGK